MEGGHDYDAAASAIKIEDIVRSPTNRMILRRLKENDPNLVRVAVTGSDHHNSHAYRPEGAHDLGWVGYYIGKNTYLKKLQLANPLQYFDNDGDVDARLAAFFRGVNNNRSIQVISFGGMDLSGGMFQSLRPFFGNNHELSKLMVSRCNFMSGCAHQLSVALRGCNKSLKSIIIAENGLGDEPLVDIITALSAHPQLANLDFRRMNVGRNECTALAALLSSSATGLHSLNLCYNDNDEGWTFWWMLLPTAD